MGETSRSCDLQSGMTSLCMRGVLPNARAFTSCDRIRSSETRGGGVTALKGLIVVAAVALGALFAFGSVVAALFEVRGFRRDGDPRPGYLFLLALGFAGSVGIPWLLWRLLLPHSAPGWIIAFVTSLVGVVLIFGMSFR
jgi:hypothetical protein